MTPPAALAVLSGLGLGFSLIVAIGAQNAFVLRQGLRGERILLVVAVCAVSDIVLIAAGVTGAGLVLQSAAWVVPAIRIVGTGFLLVYGVLAARRALRPRAAASLVPAPDNSGTRSTAVFVTTLGLTWLNPHVYLDTVILLGSIAGSHGAQRWWFAAGAGLSSALWFGTLGWGASLLRPVFARPRAWRVLDGLIAATMVALAVSIAAGG